MRRTTAAWMVMAAVLALTACASRERASQLEETLRQYGALVRWSEWAAAADFYDPEQRRENPITRLEMDRLAQVKVSGYNEGGRQLMADGTRARQTAQISLYNVHTMAERVIVDHQVWRWDEEAERWWLVSGLPDITAGR